MAEFFINRPVLAWVMAILVMLGGGLAMTGMPVNQYPTIAPPTISIQVTYPGASAQTLQDSVVQVIEQQMNGLDRLEYMASESNADGSMTLAMTFAQGTNPDTAQVQVQNKLALAQPMLPTAVQQQGIRVTKATTNNAMVLSFISRDGSLTRQDIADYVATNIQDPISRTDGVGDFQLFGSPYAMRIWLNPTALNNYSLTAADVSRAIGEQNVDISSGQLGGLPAARGQEMSATIQGPTRMQTPDEFGAILLKTAPDGSAVRLRDVARIELGAQNYSISTWYNGEPAVGLAIRLATNANALETARAVDATLAQLQPFFPASLEVVKSYDTTPFISISIENVFRTLVEAIILVFAIMFLFLQNWRATLIPTLAVPVVMTGTFGLLAMFGFTINTMTMFAMVLAIGLLVDDAIVVVENVERLMHEEQLSPRDAALKSMKQISGALVGITMVLSAVFIPMAFFGGATGVIYRQFSVTIIAAMLLSVLVAMIFTPALCATLLKPASGNEKPVNLIFRHFNRILAVGTDRYSGLVGRNIQRPVRLLLLYGALLVGTALIFLRIPTSFLPQEDQGILFLQLQSPAGASAERAQQLLLQASEYVLKNEKETVYSAFVVSGLNFAGRAQNTGMMFIRLRPWDERTTPSQTAEALATRLNAVYSRELRDASAFVAMPPPVRELGNVAGFNFQLKNQGGMPYRDFQAAKDNFLAQARASSVLRNVRLNSLEDAPQYRLVIDREKARALSVPLTEINDTLSLAWGSGYVNDFVDKGRVKRVYVQGEADARMQPEDLGRWYVRNENGEMVPFSAFASAVWEMGAQKLTRYNGVPAFNIQGLPAEGRSSGEAMAEMERIAATMPTGIGYEWTGLSFEEQQAGSQTTYLYIISLLIVFLCLAGLYESWIIPSVVLLSVPAGIIGTLLSVSLRGLENDVYFQVGLLTTIGLAAKNAILIVEFAKAHYDSGHSLMESAILAARQRLRPIIMTSLAFILGVLPLYFATGAGASSQNAIGSAVLGGMLASTFLAILFVPVFFVLIIQWCRVRPRTSSPLALNTKN